MDKILIVDDDKDILLILSDLLEMEGYEPVVADTGKDAVLKMGEFSPEMVLLDVRLPGMNGLQVLKKIKDIDRCTAVIMLTGHADIQDAVQAIKMGAFNYVTKPFKDTEIVQNVRDALKSYHLGKKKNLPPLSQREIEVLKWLRNGKSSWDVSVILGISERTVNFHINNVMKKLEAVTRTQAVATAIENELIDID